MGVIQLPLTSKKALQTPLDLSKNQSFVDIEHLEFSEDFLIPKGETTIIMGRSGVGKTTLLEAISENFVTNKISFTYIQHDQNLLPWFSVGDNIALENCLKNTKKDEDRLKWALDAVNLHDASLFPHQLSRGMIQRTSLARALYENKDFIILDEPFNHIDMETLHKIQSTFLTFFKNKTVIMSTHDPREVPLFSKNNHYIHLSGNPVTFETKAA